MSFLIKGVIGLVVCIVWGISIVFTMKNTIESVAPISKAEAIDLLLNYGTEVDKSSIVISRNYTVYSGRITGKVKQNGYWKTVNVTTRHRVEDPFWNDTD